LNVNRIRERENEFFRIKRLRGEWKGLPALKNALIKAFEPSEKCDFFSLEFQEGSKERDLLLYAVSQDMASSFEECHYGLVEKLLAEYESLRFKSKQSCGLSLCHFFEHCPTDFRRRIIDIFINSSEKFSRNRAYQLLRKEWHQEYLDIIQNNWEQYGDQRAANFIVDYSDDDYVYRFFDKIAEDLVSEKYLRSLFIRVVRIDKKFLDDIREYDEITYTYVLAKVGLTIGYDDALKIFERNKFSSRVGILIWCFSQMGQTRIISQISNDLERIEADYDADLRKRYRIDV
jgi:hypothetical protein